MNISSVLRDHGVGTGIKPEGTAIPADVLSGKSFINKDGKQVGGMPYRTGNVTGKSISRSGTTLRIKPQTGYVDDTTNVQWSDPNWIAGNIRKGVSIFGLQGTLEEGRKVATGNFTTDATGYGTVTGLAFRPRTIVMTRSTSVTELITYSEDVQNTNGNINVVARNGETFSFGFVKTTDSGFNFSVSYLTNRTFNYVAYS